MLFYSEINKENIEIFGFNWDAGNCPEMLKWRSYRVMITKNNNEVYTLEEKDNLKNCLLYFTNLLGFRKSTVFFANKKKGLYVRYSAQWMQYPYLISLIHLLIRMGTNFTSYDDWVKENKNSLHIKTGVVPFVKYYNKCKKLIKVAYDVYKNISDFHNNSGICGTMGKIKNGELE